MITVATAAELAAAMAQQRGSLVSAPQPLQIGSYTGVVFTAAPIPGTDCDTPSGGATAGGRRRPDAVHGRQQGRVVVPR